MLTVFGNRRWPFKRMFLLYVHACRRVLNTWLLWQHLLLTIRTSQELHKDEILAVHFSPERYEDNGRDLPERMHSTLDARYRPVLAAL